jgi:hypothetical protein
LNFLYCWCATILAFANDSASGMILSASLVKSFSALRMPSAIALGVVRINGKANAEYMGKRAVLKTFDLFLKEIVW